MISDAFSDWLRKRFAEGGYVPVPDDGLSSEETSLARKIQEERDKIKSLESYANVYMQALSGVEKFYDMTVRALSALIRIGKLGEKDSDIPFLCNKALEIVSQELPFENCSIMMKDENSDNLVLIAGKGKGDRYDQAFNYSESITMKIGEGIAGTVAKTGEYLFVPDVKNDKRFKNFKTQVVIRSLLCVPLVSDNVVIGVVNFSHPLIERFDETKIRLIDLLIGFLGQILVLSKLHNRMASWNDDLAKKVKEKTVELRKKNRTLERIATRDSLTGLYNRRHFFSRLEEEFSRSVRYNEHFSLLIIDLDNLKPINDTYGHIAGDRVLKEVARVMKKSGRKGDVIARIGGDEFGFILVDGSEKNAYIFKERIRENLSKVDFKKLRPEPTVSIGIAHSKMKDFKKSQDIYKAADDALYVAKKNKNILQVVSK